MKTKLLISLLLVHWLADYTHLSTPWMLQAKKLGTPLLPILCHAVVHGLLMALVLIVADVPTIRIVGLVLLQIVTHFGIDVLKGKMNVWFPELESPTNPYHWYVFGFDQYLHILVIILMSYWA